MEYRVWCKNKQEWEKDQFALLGNGQLIQLKNMQPLREESHYVEFYTDWLDKNSIKAFVGDIVKFDDGVIAIINIDASYGKYTLLGCNRNYLFSGYNIAISEVIGNIHEGIFIDKEDE